MTEHQPTGPESAPPPPTPAGARRSGVGKAAAKGTSGKSAPKRASQTARKQTPGKQTPGKQTPTERTEPAEPLELVAERAAAAAARSVPGVESLRPGLFATVIRAARNALPGSVTTREAGVSAQLRGDELHVHVQLATDGSARVLDVVREVRTEVAARVEAESGHAAVVHVIVTDVAATR